LLVFLSWNSRLIYLSLWYCRNSQPYLIKITLSLLFFFYGGQGSFPFLFLFVYYIHKVIIMMSSISLVTLGLMFHIYNLNPHDRAYLFIIINLNQCYHHNKLALGVHTYIFDRNWSQLRIPFLRLTIDRMKIVRNLECGLTPSIVISNQYFIWAIFANGDF